MKKNLAVLALVLGLALTGCTAAAGSASPDTTSDNDMGTPAPAADPSFAPTPEVEEPDPNDSLLSFGEAMTWTDGVALSVSAPVPFQPTEYAAGATLANHVLFTLVLTNNSTEVLEPIVYARVSSGGAEGSSIYDSGNDVGELGGSPHTAILPGQTVQWLEAYSINDPAAITFQVSPSFEYEDAIFTNIPQ